eukprot:2700047-Amphidinium_carterae.1
MIFARRCSTVETKGRAVLVTAPAVYQMLYELKQSVACRRSADAEATVVTMNGTQRSEFNQMYPIQLIGSQHLKKMTIP